MKRSRVVEVSLVASLAAVLTSCEGKDRRYCVDANQQVTDDDGCERRDARYHWYYARGFGNVGNGTRVTGGTVVAPSGGFRSRAGGSVFGGEGSGSARGGIGAAGEAAAGHGGFGGE